VEEPKRIRAAARGHRRVALLLEDLGERSADIGVVVDDENRVRPIRFGPRTERAQRGLGPADGQAALGFPRRLLREDALHVDERSVQQMHDPRRIRGSSNGQGCQEPCAKTHEAESFVVSHRLPIESRRNMAYKRSECTVPPL